MLTLTNRQLRVELLDPVADRPRLGPRFCWGGFIWQVHDAEKGPLLSGPEWPSSQPCSWNAQGLPESFRHRTRAGIPLTWKGDRGVAFGAGELALNAAGEPEVVAPCDWTITAQPNRIHFHTRQQAAGFDYELTRQIELVDRTVISISELINHGATAIRSEWFAHPFFALTDRLIHATVPIGTSLSENPGFALSHRDLRLKRRFVDQKDGHLDFLVLPKGEAFAAELTHPTIEKIVFDCRFVPSECLIWANSATFSIEPYQERVILPAGKAEWSLQYTFGL